MRDKVCFLSFIFLLGSWSVMGEVAEKVNPDTETSIPKTELSEKEKELSANLNEARRALEFGIDGTVLSVIGQSASSKDKRLAIDIEKQFSSLNADVQKAAIDYFIAINDFGPRPRIETMLANHNDYQTRVVVGMLRFLREEKKPASAEIIVLLLELSESSKPEIQSAAIEVIGIAGGVAQVDSLLKLFKKSSTGTSVRASIVKVFGVLKTPDTFKFLKDIVEDKSEEKTLRYEALSSLGRHGKEDSLKVIGLGLLSGDVFERGAAINALAGFETSQVLSQYKQALRDSYWRNRVTVLKVIAEKKIDRLTDAVIYLAEKDPEKPVQAESFRTLSDLNADSGWTFMLTQFQNEKVPIENRGIIAELLIKNKFLAAKESIQKVMVAEWKKEKSWILNLLCRELVNLKSKDAADLYERMLDHSDYLIRIAGVRGISESGSDSLKPKLEAILKTNPVAALKVTIEEALKK